MKQTEQLNNQCMTRLRKFQKNSTTVQFRKKAITPCINESKKHNAGSYELLNSSNSC